MRFRNIVSFFAIALLLFGLTGSALAQKAGYKLSAPYSYKNLTIFLIHGKDQTKRTNILTLQEAMEKDLFVVYETSEVNELEVENLSKEFDVFIQSGDIVKGGKQDRVLAISIIIPARSGRIKIASFCVESGRWEKREGESTGKFSSSNDRIVTKDLKVAANETRSQKEVWDGVAEAQGKLASNLGAPVASEKSKTSLQLALEDKKVKASIDEYIKNLSKIADGKADVIGYAFAINGEINSADIYLSNTLFKKLWQKMLKASATEAVAELNAKKTFSEVKADKVSDFLDEADKGKEEEKVSAKGLKVVRKQKEANVVFEARDEKSKAVVHKNYIKIN